MLPPPVHLDNGVEVNVIPMMSTDLIAISILFCGGQWAQHKKLQSDFAAQQIKSGTAHLSADTLEDRLDYYGATITSGASITHCFVRLNCLRRTLPEALPLFCEMLTSPAYEQPLLEHSLEEGIMSYQVSEQKVAYVSKRIFYQQLLGKQNPAAQYVEEADYHSICRDDLLHFHRQFLTLSNAVIYVTGKVDEQLLSLLNRHLGNIPCDQPHLHQHLPAAITTSPQMMHEETLPVPSVQSGLRMGKVMPDNSHADYPALHLTSVLLGGYFGSRLMKNIRERLGFTYGISSNFFSIPYNNIFFIATETPRKHVAQCVAEIRKDLLDLQTRPVSQEELTNARNFMLGQFCRITETSMSLNVLMMNQRAQGFHLSDLLHEQQIIQSLTPADIQRCAQQYFSPDEMLIAAAHGK